MIETLLASISTVIKNLAATKYLAIAGRIIIIIVISYLTIKVADRAVVRALTYGRERNKVSRLATLITLFQSIIKYVVYFVALVLILQLMGVRTSSLLASAGVLGLVVGFGAQNLIRDVIAGFFILAEDQFAVGDYIQVDNLSGFVTEIGLRATRLKDWGGEIHVVPNGQITKVTNHSRANRRAVVDIRVPYHQEVGKIMEIIGEVCEDLKTLDYVQEGPTLLGIVDLGDFFQTVRVAAMTLPLRQGELEREIRLRVKKKFEDKGIVWGPPVLGRPAE